MPTIQEQREERAGLVEKMHGILDTAEKESRTLTAEQSAEYDGMLVRVEEIESLLKAADDDGNRRQRLTEIDEEMSRPQGRKSPAGSGTPKPGGEGAEHGTPFSFSAELLRCTAVEGMSYGEALTEIAAKNRNTKAIGALRKYISHGMTGLGAGERAALQVDNDSSGGFTVVPEEFLAQLIKVSKTLLRKSAIPAEQLVRDRLGYKFSVTEEQAFLTGSGANQPLGVFTASNDGIPTSRDMSTDNSTTAITADGLINAKYNLKAQYMASPNLRWIFSRTAVRNIRKLKDGNGQYLWMAGLAGTPDSILEVPYLMSEYAPSTFTTGLYVGIIGDFTHYWIAESLRMELQRLDELYAATNQVGFIGRMELDGMPVLAEAFTRVTLS